jgi:hypothetical protein
VVQFRRELTGNQMEMWRSLLDMLRGMTISTDDDIVIWTLEKHGCFSTRSMYRYLCFGGVISNQMREVWGTRSPLKVRIFLWQMLHDKLQTVEQQKKREWNGEINCVLCGVVEDVNHIMLHPMWSDGGC